MKNPCTRLGMGVQGVFFGTIERKGVKERIREEWERKVTIDITWGTIGPFFACFLGARRGMLFLGQL